MYSTISLAIEAWIKLWLFNSAEGKVLAGVAIEISLSVPMAARSSFMRRTKFWVSAI